ncbi:hypothetical protein ABID21_001481 [Pseudorhizobium tarimense]|uniref:Enolase C-terminal domain-containing protein n=1 Tax=Pseudorhizobium tarimense TaxID=1079109 RepID=A0ABV2H4A2_9HYPH|nr:hypothetical protein [Pseudorhizobium tarimense]MCJ8518601.1 hypothetical protein [Pseudorhizobium tarimense]
MDGAFYVVPDAPGLGVDVNEAELEKMPFEYSEPPHLRRTDGSFRNWCMRGRCVKCGRWYSVRSNEDQRSLCLMFSLPTPIDFAPPMTCQSISWCYPATAKERQRSVCANDTLRLTGTGEK